MLFGFVLFSLVLKLTSSLETNSCKDMMKTVSEIFPKPRAHWVGDGFHVHPVFGNAAFSEKISPFLMFDYAQPKEFPKTSKKLGVGRHPHRGFTTITLAMQGEIEHGDSKGHRDVIGPGDVQWMKAARGIIHEEFHSTKFREKGGVLEMCQLWLDLPKQEKLSDPQYQPIVDKEIPRVNRDGYYVRVIAGTLGDTKGPAQSASPVELFHVICTSDQPVTVTLDSPKTHNALLFAARGSLSLGEKTITESQVALMTKDGDSITFQASPKAQILLMGGQPLNQRVVNHGPFVMTSQADIEQAFDDYQSGNFS